MKKLSSILIIFFAVILFTLPCAATPKATFPEPVFEFDSLPEGEYITHEFIVRNEGDTMLTIINVFPP